MTVWDHVKKPSLNWLLVCLPAAIVAEIAHKAMHASWASPTLIFVLSAIAIIPLAGWMGHATEQLAMRLGEGIGGLLNATLGNAAELIIAVMALVKAFQNPEKLEFMHGIVKASLTGSIIGNMLLVLGLALLLGGVRHSVQRFNATGARANATLLILATVAFLVPASFTHLAPPAVAAAEDLSLEISVLLLLGYGLSLLFSLHTHKHLYVGSQAAAAAPAAGPVAAEGHEQRWPLRTALFVMLGATVFVGLLAEFMVGSVEAAAHTFGLTEVFVGVIVVAIVGNAAEHSTAVLMAWRNRMDLTMTIAIGSSIQIALFVAPVLVLLSLALGQPMNLVFTPAEVLAVIASVFVVSQISGDGESHWLEGVLLLMVYAMIGAMFFHLPASA